MAEILLASSRFQPALDALEMALSQDFNLRNEPRFKTIKGKVLKNQGNYEEAIIILTQGIALSSIREAVHGVFSFAGAL